MVGYSKVNVKLTDTQLKKLKTVVKTKTGTTLRMIFKMSDENDLPHELLLTTRQKTELRNAFNNNISTDIKLSKAQIAKISKLAGPLMKVPVPLAKRYFSSIRKYSSCFSNWCRNSKENTWFMITTLIISNEEMNDIMKIVQALEDSNVLLKGVTKTIKNETKEQKEGFLSMLLGTPRASLLGNSLLGKGIIRAGSRYKKGKGFVRAG